MTEELIGIYKITSPSGKIYIGQSVNINKRFGTYRRLHCKSQAKLYASFLKYGFNSHQFEIIELCELDKLNEREKYYVDYYNSFDSINGLNIRDGGGNNGRLSDEQKTKISQSLTGVKHSKERIEKNRLGHIGKKLTEEHKEKIRKTSPKNNLGKKASPETRRKQSISHLGKTNRLGCKLSEDQKKHLSNINRGELNPNYGKNKTQEAKTKISESLKTYWKIKKQCQKS